MPGWERIGPYAGKETAALVVWLASWGLLHATIGRRNVHVRRLIVWFAAGVFLLLLAAWPPVYHAWFGWPPTHAGS